MTFNVKHTFDEKNFRHYMNGFNVVLHCHHYMSLTTKLAMDFDDIGGTRILSESAEDSILPILTDYIKKNNVTNPDDRLRAGADFYKEMGMGKMTVSGNADGGQVILEGSHVDKGWITKWGKHNGPVNHFTRGYIAAIFAAGFDKPARSYAVTEKDSIVTGAGTGSFAVEKTKEAK
jgi:hypothetical protein